MTLLSYMKKGRNHLSFPKGFTLHPMPRSSERGSTPCSRSEKPECPDRKVVGAGFTLVELLVVITVIGILTAGILSAINPLEQFKKAHDTQRKSDLAQIQKILDVYNIDHGAYPATADVNFGSQFFTYGVLPDDPITTQHYGYESVDSGDGYRLFAKLERCSDSQILDATDCQSGLHAYNYSVTSPNIAPGGANGFGPTAAPTPTTVPIPNTPTNVAVVAGNAQATVSWDAVSGADSYIVTVNPADVSPVTTTNTSVTITGLTNYNANDSYAPYAFTVAATNAGGTGPASNPIDTPMGCVSTSTNTPYAPKNSPCGDYGDVNGDGRVSCLDPIIVQQFDAGGNMTPDQARKSDINAKSITDSLCLLRFLANIDTTFGICPNANATTVPGGGCRTPVNLLTNPGFDPDLTGWICYANNGTCTIDTQANNTMAKITSAASKTELSQRGNAGDIPLTPGQQMCMYGYVKKQSAADIVNFYILEGTGGTNQYRKILASTTSTTDWQLIRSTVTPGVDWNNHGWFSIAVETPNATAWFDNIYLSNGACQ